MPTQNICNSLASLSSCASNISKIHFLSFFLFSPFSVTFRTNKSMVLWSRMIFSDNFVSPGIFDYLFLSLLYALLQSNHNYLLFLSFHFYTFYLPPTFNLSTILSPALGKINVIFLVIGVWLDDYTHYNAYTLKTGCFCVIRHIRAD